MQNAWIQEKESLKAGFLKLAPGFYFFHFLQVKSV